MNNAICTSPGPDGCALVHVICDGVYYEGRTASGVREGTVVVFADMLPPDAINLVHEYYNTSPDGGEPDYILCA